MPQRRLDGDRSGALANRIVIDRIAATVQRCVVD